MEKGKITIRHKLGKEISGEEILFKYKDHEIIKYF